MGAWQVSGARIRQRLEELAAIGRDPAGGWTRFPFTEEDRRARALVIRYMRAAGLQVRVDPAGNIFGLRGGLHPGLPPVASGSHLDTVRCGGMFDGTVGVVCALEVAQVLDDVGAEHELPYEVVVFADEEGARFGGGLLGSRAMLGQVTADELREQRDEQGISAWEAMERFGLAPADIASARVDRGRFTCFYEVHIEQGRVLESAGRRLGVVEGIVGIVCLTVRLAGEAAHAGTTPMGLRRDALAGAAEAILAVEEVARQASPTAVGTVGCIRTLPGSPNVVPAQVEFSVDLRDLQATVMDGMVATLRRRVADICARRGLAGEVTEALRVSPVALSRSLAGQLAMICEEFSIPYLRMASGAGHDSQVLAGITDVGMLFVPSKHGISHTPLEESSWEDITLAAQVLLEAVRERIRAS